MQRSSLFASLSSLHTFWVAVSLVLTVVTFSLSVDGFLTPSNLLTSGRNLSFIAIVAVGATAVIVSGGIDLSVGSVMGLCAVVTASCMQSGLSAVAALSIGLGIACLCGLINGSLISFLRLSPFVVTLGMLSIARSLAVVISNNKTLFELGPDQELFLALGSAKATPLLVLACVALGVATLLYLTPWGRYVHALGGNEEAAHRTGVDVTRVKISVYVLSSALAGAAGILMVAWLGSVSSSLGTGYELTVVAATVIGGTQLTGGSGSVIGSIIGAALLEVIRNGLTLSGINPYWQGTFVGVCIILAVVVDALKRQIQGASTNTLMRLKRYGVASVGLLALMLVLFIAIPRTIPQPRRVFAVVPKFMNHPFFEQAKQGCERAAKEMPGTDCLFIGPNEPSEQAQIQILQDLITRGVQGIALAPANSSAAGRALLAAREHKIPVVTWDSDLLASDSSLREAYIGTENYKLGVELGKLFLRFHPAGGTYALLSGGAAAENLNERMKGVRDALTGKGFSEVPGTPLFCNDDSALAVQQMEDILGKYPTLNGFISLGAWPLSVQRAYRSIAEKNLSRIRSNDLVILSADTLPMQLEIVRDGLAHGLVGQRPAAMGYTVMQALERILKGDTIQDPTYTGLDICTSDTIETCINSGS